MSNNNFEDRLNDAVEAEQQALTCRLDRDEPSDVELAASEAADRLWPLRGDPTFPRNREESSGWQRARRGFLAGFKARANGEPLPFETPSPDVWDCGFEAGWCHIDPPVSK